jgi:hypothetical protein
MQLFPLSNNLPLPRCPHCAVANPNLPLVLETSTTDANGRNQRLWRIYECQRCGGLVTAWAEAVNRYALQIFPDARTIASELPERAQNYLRQAIDTLHAPSGAIMLAASAVDAMLKAKGYKDGSLYARIDQASNDGLITKDMAAWAHEIRLEANDERHADEEQPLPDEGDASRCVDFAEALGEFLFVLPSRVTTGLRAADQAKPKKK